MWAGINFKGNPMHHLSFIEYQLKTSTIPQGRCPYPHFIDERTHGLTGSSHELPQPHVHDLEIQLSPCPVHAPLHPSPPQYGLKKKEEKEAEEKAALEQPCEGSLTRPKKAIPAGCGDEEEEEEESILDTVLKYLPGPLQDMFKK